MHNGMTISELFDLAVRISDEHNQREIRRAAQLAELSRKLAGQSDEPQEKE